MVCPKEEAGRMESTTHAASAPVGRARSRLPRGMLGMLGLVVLSELAFARNYPMWRGPVLTTYEFTRNSIDTGKANVDLLILGDSVLKMGLQPKVLAERLGKTSFNLAHTGGQPLDTYFALRQALEHGAKPKAILLDYKPNLVQGSPYVRPLETVELRTWYDILELGLVGKDYSYLGQQLTAKLLPSYKHRFEIGGELMAKWKSGTRLHADLPRLFWRNWSINQGAELQSPNPWVLKTAETQDERASLLPTFFVHPVNSAFIKRTFKLAKSKGVDVYWLIPPINPRVQAKRVTMGIDADYVRYIKAFQKRFPGLKVIDGRNANYDPSLFVDATHLDHRGAYIYSSAVADALARGAGESRWAEIASYRPFEQLPPMEDMDKSRLALATGGAVKR